MMKDGCAIADVMKKIIFLFSFYIFTLVKQILQQNKTLIFSLEMLQRQFLIDV